jgi:hypothetical protein
MQLEKHSHLKVSFLCVVCDRNKREKVGNILGKHETFFNLISYGKGTANSRILNYLGLGETEKAVFFSILSTEKVMQIVDAIDTTLQMSKPGHGILFTTKVHQGCYHKPVEFSSEVNGGIMVQEDSSHSLIMVVLNRGYSEDVMDVARASGATGGTVLHARGNGIAGTKKFFGVTITPEKEILLILARDAITGDIMAGIAEKVGPATDASAVSFSLPVNNVRGIRTTKIE